jgi:hypothetical protein
MAQLLREYDAAIASMDKATQSRPPLQEFFRGRP